MIRRKKDNKNTSSSNGRRSAQRGSPDNLSDRYTRSKTLSSYSTGSNKGGDKEVEKSERQRIHRVKARQKQVSTVLGLLILLIVFVGVILFNFTSKVTVSAVSTDVDIVNAPNGVIYEESIKKYLGSHPSSRLRFSLDLEDLSKYIGDVSPEVKYIKRASFDGIGTSNYDIVFRQPIIKWQVADKVYYVDSDGVSFQNNIFAEPGIELRDSSLAGGVVSGGEAKISRRILEFSGRLVSSIQDQGYKVEYLSLPGNTTRQIAVKLVDRQTQFIFSIDHSVAGQVDAMRQVIEYMDEAGQSPSMVDLRVSNRAYYK